MTKTFYKFANQKLPDLIKLQQEQNNFILSVGTILTIDDIDYCMSLGVKIFFSPHFDSQLFHYCCLKKCILIPGVYTPTEGKIYLDEKKIQSK